MQPHRAALAAAAALALAGLVLELALRAGGAPPAVANPLHGFHRNDPVLGWAGAPDLRLRFVRPAFDVQVEHDGLGFRRPDPPPPAAARERVLVLGDSLVWGWGVGQGELFTDRLQRALAPEVAVVNRGVNAYATSQELLLLERELARGAFSQVLVFFTPGDLAENLDGKGGRRPLFALEGDRLVPRNQPPAPLMGRWRRLWKDHSLAFLWLELHANRARARLSRGEPPPETPDPEALPGAAVTARLLLEMRERSRAAGAGFQVVYVPADGELGAAPANPLAEAAHALLTRLAAAQGLPLVDLTPALAARSRGRGLRFAGDDHPDARGHRLIAEALLDGDGVQIFRFSDSPEPGAPDGGRNSRPRGANLNI
jgi:lysophospholipase L1-like esterase